MEEDKFTIICLYCNRIIANNMLEKDIKKLGKYIQCPYCLGFMENPENPLI
jgi:DNA-directed RNA polymerase subunit RPC12/RpoP